MWAKLPDRIDPKRLAHHGARLSGEIPVEALQRLCAAYVVKSAARVELQFGWAGEHRPTVKGELSVRLGCTCQRCLRAFELTVEATVDYEIGESPRDSEQDFELVLAADEALSLTGFVEDELLLEAPMIPVHDAAECAAPAGAEAVATEEENRRRPFAGLQKLMDSSSE